MDTDYSKFTDDELAELLAKAQKDSDALYETQRAANADYWNHMCKTIVALRNEVMVRAAIKARTVAA